MSLPSYSDANMYKGLNLGDPEDRAIFRQRVSRRYSMMKLGALREEAGLGRYATRTMCERKIADDLIIKKLGAVGNA